MGARITPRKARFIADLVKGLPVADARAQLTLNPRRPSPVIIKLLLSAVANAKEQKMDVDKLFIKSIVVNQGKMLKRFLPRARGSASPIQKKMCHIILVLEENPKLRAPRFSLALPVRAKKGGKAESGKKMKNENPEKSEKAPEKIAKVKEGRSVTKAKEPGAIKKIFARKTGTA